MRIPMLLFEKLSLLSILLLCLQPSHISELLRNLLSRLAVSMMGPHGSIVTKDPRRAEVGEEVRPHVRYSTYLAIFSVNIASVALAFAITGAGTVCLSRD
ncbi:hypothetical protein F5Y14DRAFT_415372 [Nemania sp. NC0429]|nr:hypothetical protein F5Y14DRAFT_415372 [Nemania sp. NC0429]